MIKALVIMALGLISGCANLKANQWGALALKTSTYVVHPMGAVVDGASAGLDVLDYAGMSAENYEKQQREKTQAQTAKQLKQDSHYDENGEWIYIPYDAKRANSGL